MRILIGFFKQESVKIWQNLAMDLYSPKVRKRMRTVCNICLESQTDIKCSQCSFECCYQCIYNWAERSHNCPQCRKFETYDIEYSLLTSEEESVYEESVYEESESVYEDLEINLETYIRENENENGLENELQPYPLSPPPSPLPYSV